MNTAEALLNDLRWLIASAPLLTPAGDPRWPMPAFYQALSDDSQPLWQQLADDPQPLLDFMAQRPVRRLGLYAENLLCFWLQHPDNPRYRLVAEHLTIRREQLTLGELDFLVQDRRSGEVEHWELAVKFYLGRPANALDDVWVGPGLADTLARKYQHLINHQLVWQDHPEGQAVIQQALARAGLPSCRLRVRCWMKGRLYYPMPSLAVSAPIHACSEHERGNWIAGTPSSTRPDMHERLHRRRWVVSPSWLSEPLKLR